MIVLMSIEYVNTYGTFKHIPSIPESSELFVIFLSTPGRLPRDFLPPKSSKKIAGFPTAGACDKDQSSTHPPTSAGRCAIHLQPMWAWPDHDTGVKWGHKTYQDQPERYEILAHILMYT